MPNCFGKYGLMEWYIYDVTDLSLIQCNLQRKERGGYGYYKHIVKV